MSMIMHYGEDGGEPTVYTPSLTSTDPDIAGLAQALDATIDAASDALDEGNVGQAQALLVAADTTSDSLLEALGVPDADDPDVA